MHLRKTPLTQQVRGLNVSEHSVLMPVCISRAVMEKQLLLPFFLVWYTPALAGKDLARCKRYHAGRSKTLWSCLAPLNGYYVSPNQSPL